MQETPVDSWVGKICCRRDRRPTPVFLGLPGSSASKESVCNAGDLGSIPGLGRYPGEGKGYSLQYSGLMDCIVPGVAKSWTRLSDFHFTSLHLVAQWLRICLANRRGLSEVPLWKEVATPLQYTCLGSPMDRGAWQSTVHGVTKTWTQLSN